MVQIKDPFQLVSIPVIRRLFVASWGLEGVGKTHFGLTGPEPIRVLNVDKGLEELARKFTGKNLSQTLYTFPGSFEAAAYSQEMGRLEREYLYALQHSAGGTVIVDGGSDVWSYMSDTELQPIMDLRIRRATAKGSKDAEAETSVQAFDYGAPNRRMNAVLNLAYDYPDVNVLWTHRSRPVYQGRDPVPGKFEPQWFKHTPFKAQVVLYHFVQEGGFYTRITKNRIAPETVGMVVEGLDWPMLSEMCGVPGG